MNPPMNPPPETTPAADERPKPPSKVRAVVAGYEAAGPRNESSILVQRRPERIEPGWKRLVPGKSEIFSTDDLVSLPGYNSELALGADRGAHLLLHGHVPQFTIHPIMDFLMESTVRLHQPEAGFDADLTLDPAASTCPITRQKAPSRCGFASLGRSGTLRCWTPTPRSASI